MPYLLYTHHMIQDTILRRRQPYGIALQDGGVVFVLSLHCKIHDKGKMVSQDGHSGPSRMDRLWMTDMMQDMTGWSISRLCWSLGRLNYLDQGHWIFPVSCINGIRFGEAWIWAKLRKNCQMFLVLHPRKIFSFGVLGSRLLFREGRTLGGGRHGQAGGVRFWGG